MSTAPKLAVLTSGGDAPGMNMAVWTLTQAASAEGWEVLGVRDGFVGLLEGRLEPLTPTQTLSWARYGGTKLGTSRLADLPSHADKLLGMLEHHTITTLAILGGNGSAAAAAHLHSQTPNLTCVVLPATIDNDVVGSDASIGFDTALNTGVRLLDGIRDSAEAMPRLFALETLGGDTGFLAQAVARAGAADALLVPERVLADDAIITQLQAALTAKRYAIIVASEGYPETEAVLERVSDKLGVRYRFSKTGHAQRGGQPSGRDRLLASELALTAWQAVKINQSGRTVWQAGKPTHVPFANAVLTTNKPFMWTFA
ncbi:MAG: 6-phosphofructokinase [Deinococcota bacterium]